MELTRSDLQVLLGRPPEPVPAPPATASQGPIGEPIAALSRRFREPSGRGRKSRARTHRNRRRPPRAAATPRPSARPRLPPAGAARLSDIGTVTSVTEREQNADRRADRYRVEIFKKWSLSFASIPFVLIAVAMALRFPRGGMGLVLGGGMFVYSVFYVGLTAGETLADRGLRPAGRRDVLAQHHPGRHRDRGPAAGASRRRYLARRRVRRPAAASSAASGASAPPAHRGRPR